MPSLLSQYAGRSGSLISRYTQTQQPEQEDQWQDVERFYQNPINQIKPQTLEEKLALQTRGNPSALVSAIRGDPAQQGAGENFLRGSATLIPPMTVLTGGAVAQNLIQHPIETAKGVPSLFTNLVKKQGWRETPAENVATILGVGALSKLGLSKLKKPPVKPVVEPVSIAEVPSKPKTVATPKKKMSIIARYSLDQLKEPAAESFSKKMLEETFPKTQEEMIQQKGYIGKSGSVELGALGTPTALKEFATGTSPLNKWWEGKVDRGFAKAGKYVPDVIKKALIPEYGLPEKWKTAKETARVAEQKGIAETTELAARGAKEVPKSDYGLAYDYLDPTERNIVRPKIDPAKTADLDAIRSQIDKMSKEAVDAGILDPKTAGMNEGTYLKRFYSKYEESSSNQVKRLFKQFRIRGMKARKLGSVEQRDKAGIIRDPYYSFAKGASQLRHDIETSKLFKMAATDKDFANLIANEWSDGFAKQPLPNSKSFGALRGKYVEQYMYDDIMDINRNWAQGNVSKLYDKMLGAFKYSKTGLNPATHGRNIGSSIIQADVIGGVSPARIDHYVSAAKDFISKGEAYKELQSLGKIDTGWAGSELANFLAKNDVNKPLWRQIFDYPGKIYVGEENFFKVVVYKYQRSIGKSPSEAIKVADKAIPDYRQVTPFIKGVRRYAIPFISYPYKMLPQLTKAAIKHPVRVGKYFVLFKALNEYAKQQLGLSDDEYTRIKKTKAMDGTGKILLPYRDKDGNPEVLDLTYNMPWGDMLEYGVPAAKMIGLTESSGRATSFVSQVNPFLKIPGELAFNRESYTGKELFRPSHTTGEKTAIGAKHTWKQLAPPLAPGGYGFEALSDVATGSKTKYGETRDPRQTFFRNVLGIKETPVNVARESSQFRFDRVRVIKDLESRMREIARDKSLSEQEKQSMINELRLRIQKEAGQLK